MSMFAAMLATDLADYRDIRYEPTGHQVEKFLTHQFYWASQKIDGRRMQAVRSDDTILLLNRNGEPFTFPLDPAVRADLLRLDRGWWLDGEYLAGVYYIFDVVGAPNGMVEPDMTFRHRWHALTIAWDSWHPSACERLQYATSEEEKRSLLSDLRAHQAEGLVFRYSESTYQFGIRSPLLVKCKFWRSADVIAFNIGREGKSSTSLAVYHGDKLRDIGAVTLSGDLLKNLQAGTVLEVKYLYLSDAGRLVQPSVLRIRTDKLPDECVYSQLVGTNKDVLA